VFELFNKLITQGKTMLMVTHDKELARHVPRMVEIIDGRITRDEYIGERAWTGY
jgi:putative ABC transport system ATP-binding protein